MKVEFADKTDLSVVHWPHCDILLCLVLLCVLCVYVFDTCVERNICTSCVAEPSCGLGEFRTSNCREGTLRGVTSFVPINSDVISARICSPSLTSSTGTNDVRPPSVPSLQFEVLHLTYGHAIT